MIDVEPLIVSGLDRLVPLPSGAGADWQDVLRRAGESPRRGWLGLRRPRRRSRLRLALVVVAATLVLAGVATATYVAVHTWVSSSPRGPQYVSTYRLSTIFSTMSLGAVESVSLGPGGHDLYLVRDGRWTKRVQRAPQIWRIAAVDQGGAHRAHRVVDFLTLSPSQTGMWRGGVSVAPNGDLFAVACMPRVGLEPECDLTLYVVRPDGTHQRVVSGTGLIRASLVPRDGGWWWTPAVPASNRLWISVAPSRGLSRLRLVEVVDPNADGDWQDRVLERLVLPASLPSGFWQIAAEPSLPGNDRSGSVVATVRTRGSNARVYRIADVNGDGDALDPGEVRQLLTTRRGTSLLVSPLVVDDGGVLRHELAIARGDRVSVLDDSGGFRDLGRAFAGVQAIVGGSHGRMYVVADRRVYLLEPGVAEAGSRVSSPRPSSERVFRLPPPVASGAPRLMFEISGHDRGRSYTVGADGTGLRTLVPGVHVYEVCQSADGREVAFASDPDVPTELSTYLARDGERPRRAAGRYARPICAFPAGSAPMTRSAAITVLRHALPAGGSTVAAGRISSGTVSPDGTKLVAARSVARSPGHARRETLDFVDLRTGRYLRLASLDGTEQFGFVGGPSPEGGAHVVAWSPDGMRVAYYTLETPRSATYWDPVRHRTIVWVRDVATGTVVMRFLLVANGRPFMSWSPEGTRLLVCAERRGMQPACPAAAGDVGGVAHTPARLLLVDLRDRSVRVVARGRLTFASWAPSGGSYAYAVGGDLYIRAPDGSRRHVARIPEAYLKRGLPWLGWSPDGRFIALGTDGLKEIPTIGLKSGQIITLRPFGAVHYENVRWWRPPSP